MSDQTTGSQTTSPTRSVRARSASGTSARTTTQVTEMLKALGLSSLEALMDDAVPGRIRQPTGSSCRRPPRSRRPPPSCVQLAELNNPLVADDRPGLPRHDHPAGDPAQRARGPVLVHRLHAVPAGDQPGPARGAAELPDDGRRPHRAADLQRLAARRGHRGRRGDDAGTSRQPKVAGSVRRRRRRPAADHRGGAHPRRGDGHRGRRGRPRRRAARGRPLRRAGAVPRRLRADPRPAAGDRGGARARRARRRGRRPARPDPARVAGLARRRRRGRLVASASASRCSTAARTPASCRCAPGSSATCPVGSSASRSTRPADRRTGSRCRRASSTSAATGRPPTSAPPRCCWPWSPRCTPSTTVPRA